MTTKSFVDAYRQWCDEHRAESEITGDFWSDIRHLENNEGYFAERQKQKGFSWYYCKDCGKPEAVYAEDEKSSDLCVTCGFWHNRLSITKPYLVINREFLRDGGYRKDGKHCGYAGRLWYIEDFTNDELIFTNNMWSAGKIPMRYYKGDTAKCIDSSTTEEVLSFLMMMYPEMKPEFRKHIESIREKRLSPPSNTLNTLGGDIPL